MFGTEVALRELSSDVALSGNARGTIRMALVELACIKADLHYHECLLNGSWPDSVAILERYLETAKAVAADGDETPEEWERAVDKAMHTTKSIFMRDDNRNDPYAMHKAIESVPTNILQHLLAQRTKLELTPPTE